jgi:adenylate cyclase
MRRRLFANLALAVAISSLMALALANGYLRPLQLQSGDLLFRLKPDTSPRWTVLVAIDDRSLAELRSRGRFFNWPRDLHANVIDNLKAAGARIIVWDVLFDAPGEGDAALAEAIKSAGNVVLAEVGDQATRVPEAGQTPRYAAGIEQLPAFRQAAIGIGHANQLPDTDGVIRTTPLVMNIAGQEVPSLSMVSAARFLRRPQVFEAPIQDGKLPFAGREIPVDQDGRMWVSYLGDSSEVTNPPTFPSLSYVDVYNNSFPPDLVRGKLVMVGLTATGFADDFWTPVSRSSKMDGVEIQASAFETIMRPEQFIVPVTTQWTTAVIYAMGMIPVLALLFLPVLPALIVGILAGGLYLVAAVLVIDPATVAWIMDRLASVKIPVEAVESGRILDLPFPLLTLGTAYLALLMYRVIFEQSQQRALKGALSQYLSPDVMEEVVRDPGAIKLGGEKREMTVLFSDIRGFTTISESLEPEKVVQILNVYLTRMTDIVFRHQGTVDKYMGDAIMAFWGAPKAQPDHARLACQAALEMMQELDRLNAEFERESIPRLNIGIGLNTGFMAVGNMGSARRFDYTVMGDSVNLASRLEALNKEYGTNVIVAETTLAEAGREMRTRFLDLVAVKGKREPSAVYELLVSDGRHDSEQAEALAAYERGIVQYRAGAYRDALVHFEHAQRLNGHDSVSAVYAERCRALIENPPPPDWDGVFVMTHK